MINNQTIHDLKKIVTEAFFYVIEHRLALAKALAWPFAAFLAIDAAAYLDPGPGSYFILTIMSLVLQVVFAITTHRVVLLGPESVSAWGLRSWTKRETFFLLHGVGLALLAVPFVLIALIPVLGPVVAFLIFCWLVSRFSLVFPGIAVDKAVTFPLSWKLTENFQLLMFMLVIAFPVLLSVPMLALGFIPFTSILSSLVSTLLIVFEVAVISLAYQHITPETYCAALPEVAESESP